MRLITLLILVTALILAPGAAVSHAEAPAQSSAAVELSIQAGFDGYFRGTDWLPVFITVSNDGPAISGYLRVRGVGGIQGGSPAVFSTPIELPTQSRKQITVFVTVDEYATGVSVALYHQDLRVIEQQIAINRVQMPDVLYAILSDTHTAGVNLDRVRPFAGEAYQANITIDRLPDQAPALAALDALLITDADTGNLTDAQRQALADWVLDGGHLIISGGANWQRTTAGLGPLLPVAIDGTVTVEDISALEDYLGRRSGVSLYETPTIITTGAPVAGAEVLVSLPDREAAAPLVVRRAYGLGLVDYLAVDPTAEPLASWSNTVELWNTLLTSGDQRASWWAGFGRVPLGWTNAQDATEIIPLALPDATLILGFLAVYIILMGPLNYLVLKRLGRHEFAWFTIPAMILIFSVLAYLTGFGLRGSSAILNRIGVVQVWPGSTRATVDALIGLWSPFRTTYNIMAPADYALRPIPVASVLGAGVSVEIEQDAAYTARDVPVNIGSVRSFVVDGHLDDAPQIDAEARLELVHEPGEAEYTTLAFTGEVGNTTTFTLYDAVLLARGASQPLGDLEPGDRRSFAVRVPPADAGNEPFHSPPVALGRDFVLDPTGLSYWGSQRARGSTVNDISRPPDGFLYRQIVTERDRELRRRYLFLQALIQDLEATGGRGDNLYLAAWADHAPVDIALTGANYATVDSTLYVFAIPVTVEPADPGALVEIGPAQISWMVEEESNRRSLTPMLDRRYVGVIGQSLGSLQTGDQIGFRFTPLPGVRLREVTELIVDMADFSGNIGMPEVTLWNWAEGVWEPVVVDWGRTRLRDPARFIGPENTVKVMLYNPFENQVLLRQIEITLRGRL
ncbi:MAG: hypothetical protein JXB47_16555 [Anaerolineae bacterium]|nr:hypothetical protein [Anaerolineae bacterium]